MLFEIGFKSILISLVMFFTVQVLNVYWQTTRLTVGDIDRAIPVTDEYNLFPIPFFLLAVGIILVIASVILGRKKGRTIV